MKRIYIRFFILIVGFIALLNPYKVSSLSINLDNLSSNSKASSEYIQKKLWQANLDGITLKLGSQVLNPTLNEIGIVFNESKILKNLSTAQEKNSLKKIKELLNQNYLKVVFEIDRARLKSYLEKIAGTDFVRPTNAQVQLVENEFQIISSKEGKAISEKLLKSKITEELKSIQNLEEIKNLNIKLKYKKSLPTINEANLDPRITEANYFSKTPFIFQFENKTYTADETEIKKWIVFREINREIKVEFSDEAINKYLDLIAKGIDVKAQNTLIQIVNGERKVEIVGKDGRALNREIAIKTVKEKLNSLDRAITFETEVVKPKEIIQYPDNLVGGLYPGRYIEINASAKQKMYLWDGTTLVATYSISSGKAGYRTPSGHFKILSKNPRAYSSKYGLYMPYWNAFTSAGHGIHELPEWPGGYKEGANHLGIAVSHGCVRLGVGPAAFLYNWAPIGTPIYIHY